MTIELDTLILCIGMFVVIKMSIRQDKVIKGLSEDIRELWDHNEDVSIRHELLEQQVRHLSGREDYKQ